VAVVVYVGAADTGLLYLHEDVVGIWGGEARDGTVFELHF
jgi:hypothetical protein